MGIIGIKKPLVSQEPFKHIISNFRVAFRVASRSKYATRVTNFILLQYN